MLDDYLNFGYGTSDEQVFLKNYVTYTQLTNRLMYASFLVNLIV